VRRKTSAAVLDRFQAILRAAVNTPPEKPRRKPRAKKRKTK
jgi:hypothetical protein